MPMRLPQQRVNHKSTAACFRSCWTWPANVIAVSMNFKLTFIRAFGDELVLLLNHIIQHKSRQHNTRLLIYDHTPDPLGTVQIVFVLKFNHIIYNRCCVKICLTQLYVYLCVITAARKVDKQKGARQTRLLLVERRRFVAENTQKSRLPLFCPVQQHLWSHDHCFHAAKWLAHILIKIHHKTLWQRRELET